MGCLKCGTEGAMKSENVFMGVVREVPVEALRLSEEDSQRRVQKDTRHVGI